MLLSALLLAIPARASAGDVTVFAAASLKNAMDDIADLWEAETDHRVVPSFGGSSALARQIQHGAPADIFISANAAWMNALQQEGLIQDGTRFDLAGNRLVLIAHQERFNDGEIGPDFDLANLLGEGRLALALPKAVPAGIYGKQALQALDLWDIAALRTAQADNVRAVLALVAAGEAPAGIVYATDAMAETRVNVVGTFPKGSHDPIRYPAALVARRDNPVALDFFAFLASPAARNVLTDHGFVAVPSDVAPGAASGMADQ